MIIYVIYKIFTKLHLFSFIALIYYTYDLSGVFILEILAQEILSALQIKQEWH
jgi:hypothetical protein